MKRKRIKHCQYGHPYYPDEYGDLCPICWAIKIIRNNEENKRMIGDILSMLQDIDKSLGEGRAMKTEKIYANIESLDYYQGYFDCLKNIAQKVEKYDPEMDSILADARFQEVKMFEKLKVKYGDNLLIGEDGRGYIEGGDDED